MQVEVEVEMKEDWARWRALRQLSRRRGELEEQEKEKEVECGWMAS